MGGFIGKVNAILCSSSLLGVANSAFTAKLTVLSKD